MMLSLTHSIRFPGMFSRGPVRHMPGTAGRVGPGGCLERFESPTEERGAVMRRSLRVALAVAAFALLPAAAFAQSAIAGVVRDSSGAVMPGVTVEAASDVLIEKVRA